MIRICVPIRITYTYVGSFLRVVKHLDNDMSGRSDADDVCKVDTHTITGLQDNLVLIQRRKNVFFCFEYRIYRE